MYTYMSYIRQVTRYRSIDQHLKDGAKKVVLVGQKEKPNDNH